MGHDPSKITAGDMAQGTPRWIDADADVDEVLQEMQSHQIRRLPVIEDKRLVGMISEADLAQHLSDVADRRAGRSRSTPTADPDDLGSARVGSPGRPVAVRPARRA